MNAETSQSIELRWREREIDRLKARIAEQDARIAQLLKNVAQARESSDERAGLLQQRIDQLELAERVRTNKDADEPRPRDSRAPRRSSEFDVFVSYSREDRNKAKAIVEALTASGVRVWWDETKLRLGERFEDYISWALEDALKVVVLWSRQSVHSRYVYSEARIAHLMNKLLPIRIEDVDPPEFCAALHYVDLSSWTGVGPHSGFQELIKDVQFFVSLAR